MSISRPFGAALVIVAVLPLHRLLDPTRAGPAGSVTREVAEAAWQSSLYGTLLVLGAGLALSRIVPGARLASTMRALAERLSRPSSLQYASAMALLVLTLAAMLARLVHGGEPTSVDEMVALLHAQALRAHRLAWPLPGEPAAFLVQNGVLTDVGWASIYPPLHTLALALGAAFGAGWMVGPLALAVATFFSSRAFDAFLGGSRGRVAALLLAVSPYWLILGATHLSHATAAAALAGVAWTGSRAKEGGLGWAVAAGVALGAGVTARPWVSLACGSALLGAIWLGRPGRPWPWVIGRAGATMLGGLPFALLLFGWNDRLFGSPWRLGYSAAFGPAHGLGLHRDPWGNLYSIREAIAYTSADLLQLGARLLESPVPAMAVVGVGLLLARRRPGLAALVAWGGAAVVANALYWHHGIHFGPRMLFESTPAWIGLFTVGCAELVTRPWLRGAAAWCLASLFAGSLLLGPAAVRAAARPDARVPLPEVPGLVASERTVVFVHGSWASRVAARLAATGMRRDSIETGLRRNALCSVDRYARWRSGGSSGPPPPVDWEPRPGTPETLEIRLLGPGNPARFDARVPDDAACAREAAADRFGALDLEPLLWRFPPRDEAAVVVARDLGPLANARVMGALPGHALVYIHPETGPGTLMEYEEGMELIWRGAAGAVR